MSEPLSCFLCWFLAGCPTPDQCAAELETAGRLNDPAQGELPMSYQSDSELVATPQRRPNLEDEQCDFPHS